MIARSIPLLLALGVVLADSIYKPFEGVDPNSLSCDPEGHVFLLLPDFEDCNKFHMCAHGQEIQFSCPGGLIFSFEEQSCNWPWAGVCTLRERGVEGEEGEGGEGGEVEGSGDSEELQWAEPQHAPLGVLDMLSASRATEAHKFGSYLNCNRAESAAKHLPYRGDCQRYWRCESGVPQVAFCSDGLFFNERTHQCDFEANSKCVDAQPHELGGEFIEY